MKHSLLLSALLIALLSLGACSGDDHTHQDSDPPFDSDTGIESDIEEEPDGDGDHNENDDQEEDLDPPGPPEIDVFPSILNFSGVAPGSTAQATVTVRNLGESPLLLRDAQIDQFGVTGSEVFLPHSSWPPFPVTLEPTTFRDLNLIFAPEAPGSFRGEFLLFSDDPDQDSLSIRIETISFDPELEAPDRVRFGTVAAGDSDTIRIEVYNRGTTPMQLHAPELSSSDGQHEAFSVEVLGLPSLPGFLERNAFVYMDITFSPEDDSLHTATLTFETSDPLRPEFPIALSGNRPTPCLRTSGAVDFGSLNLGITSQQTLTLLNCSLSRNLEVHSFEIVDDGGGVFSFQLEPDDPITILPTQTRSISLNAILQTEQEVLGILRFQSNDPDSETVEENLRARPLGSDN